MAKGIWKTASADDPIYKEGLKISSLNFSREYGKLKTSSAKDTDGRKTATSTESMKDSSTPSQK